jgi:hypothetical protein
LVCSELSSSIFTGIYCNQNNPADGKIYTYILASEISLVAFKLNQLYKDDTMPIISPSTSEIFEREHIDKKEYLKNELKSLGIEPKRKDQLNDNEELQSLSDNIKQAMFQDYKIAYSEKGDMHKEEAESTVSVG